MNRDLVIKAIRPEELKPSDISLWRAFRARRPELASPYFDPGYALAAGAACPNAEIAIISRGGRIDAFFPFQRRGRLIQPLGAPLADFNGLVVRPGLTLDPVSVVRALGAVRFRFSGLQAGPDGGDLLPATTVATSEAMIADLSGGFEAWMESRKSDGQAKFFKDKRRRRTRLEQDLGAISFELAPATDADIEYVISVKREQLKQTGQHDIFDCGWTGDLLRRLAEDANDAFGLHFAALRAGDRLVAGELGLRSGDAYHLWFPIYDTEYSKYSPGQLMTLDTLEALASRGVTRVDFGAGGEAYKKAFAVPAETVFEGNVIVGPAQAALAAVPGLRGQRIKLGRRVDRIMACESEMSGRVRAFSKYAAVVAGRYSRVTAAGVGMTAGVGLTLAMMTD